MRKCAKRCNRVIVLLHNDWRRPRRARRPQFSRSCPAVPSCSVRGWQDEHDNYSYNPSSIPSSSLRCASDTAARFGCTAPVARRGRFRNRGAASVSASAGASPPPPFRSLSSRRKDIAAPRSAAADDGRPKVSIVYPALGGGRRGAFPFRRGFFAGRRDDDGAAGAGAGASREASVGGGGAPAPDKV